MVAQGKWSASLWGYAATAPRIVLRALPMTQAFKTWMVAASVLLCLLLAPPATALDAVVLQTAVIASDQPYTVRQVLRGDAGAWQPRDSSRLHFAGDPSMVYWLRISATLPASADDRWVLWFDRVALTDLSLLQRDGNGDYGEVARQFFRPEADDPSFSSGFRFPLRAYGSQSLELLLQVRSNVAFNLRPLLLSEAQYLSRDRDNVILLAAMYAGLLVLALTGLAMYIALRDRIHGAYVGFTATALFLLLAINGHAYALPVLDVLAYWRELGLLALANGLGAFTAILARAFANAGRDSPRSDFMLLWVARLLLVLALACVLNLRAFLPQLQIASLLLGVLSAVLVIVAAVLALRRRQPLARPMLFIWSMVYAAVLVRGLIPLGWMPHNSLTMYGFQAALAFAAFLLSLAMADQVMEFRKQRDRARLSMEQANASLQSEKVRRHLVESLQSGLRAAPVADLSWIALRRMLDAVSQVVPQRRSAVAVFGYQGGDHLIAEPVAAKAHFEHLLSTRGGALKGLCRTNKPVQLRLDDPGDESADAQSAEAAYAIIPLPMPRPAWGVLLIERAAWEAFSPSELREASEFVAMAMQAADDARAAQELAAKTERDALTGVLNRQAIETIVSRELESALARRTSLAVLVLGIDQLTQITERHGHAAADDCLCAAAELLRQALTLGDCVGRLGAEEFVLVLPGKTLEQARAIADKLRLGASDIRVPSSLGLCQFTLCVGGTVRASAESKIATLLDRAGKALLAARHRGVNQTHMIAVDTSSVGDPDARLYF